MNSSSGSCLLLKVFYQLDDNKETLDSASSYRVHVPLRIQCKVGSLWNLMRRSPSLEVAASAHYVLLTETKAQKKISCMRMNLVKVKKSSSLSGEISLKKFLAINLCFLS